MSSNQFNGLMMPVFSAFGWAGEEEAIKYALSQLELFIDTLFLVLGREARAFFPFYGVDKTSQSVYLSTEEKPEKGLTIAYFARPLSFETSLVLSDKQVLTKSYKVAEGQPERFLALLTELGLDWELRIQQMEYDEETKAATNYQDLYKDKIGKLDLETAVSTMAKAAYLNGEEKWVVPLHVSHRKDSEKVAAMGRTIISNSSDEITHLLPLCLFLTGQSRKKAKTQKTKPTTRPALVAEESSIKQSSAATELEKFEYVSELMPLHIRRGFINLTPEHWPFFAVSTRTETRNVTVHYEDKKDNNCAVWHLVRTDQTRVILSPAVQDWLEDNFDSDDQIKVTAIKRVDDHIDVALEPVH